MSARRRAVALAVATFCAYAVLIQALGWNQTSHFALVRAFAHGTTHIDPYHRETGDLAFIKGHYYSNKAPGLAFLTTPAYLVLDHTGAVSAANRVTGTKAKGEVLVIWALGLLGAALPAAVLVLLTGLLAARFAPETAPLAAATVGLGTLILPFATMFFSHVLAATLGFAAFVVLWRERESTEARVRMIALAGLLAGLGATAEYPAILVALVLGGYVVAGRALRPILAFAGGAALGILPVPLYNLWAFGSLTEVSYSNGVIGYAHGRPIIGGVSPHFFGFDTPSLKVAIALLVSPKGLLVLTPVLAAGAFGLVLLYRSGRRAEAWTAAAVVLVVLVFNAGYYQPLGGWDAGPRYMIDCLPFLGFAIALAYRRLPVATLALAVASILTMALATATNPQLPSTRGPGDWLHLLRSHHLTKTLVSEAGAGRGWVGILLFVAPVAVVLVLAWRWSAHRWASRDLWTGAAAVFGWACIVRFGQTAPAIIKTIGTERAAAAGLLLVAAVILVLAVDRLGPVALVAAGPLLTVLAPSAGRSPAVVIAVSLAAALVAGVAISMRRRPAPAQAPPLGRASAEP